MLEERSTLWGVAGAVFIALAVLSFLPNSTLFVIIKVGVILAAIGGTFFFLTKKEVLSAPDSAEPVDEPEQLEVELVSDPNDGPEEHVSQEYYQQFLRALFPIILNTLVADEAAFLLVNPGKHTFHIRYFLHQDGHAPQQKQFAGEATLPGLVFKQKEPLIENQLSGRIDQLVPPHPAQAPAVQSFAGVPVEYQGKPIGVLFVASASEGAFGPDDVDLLQHYARLLELELQQSSRMFQYEQQSWENTVYIDFARGLLHVKTLEHLWEFLAGAFKKYFGADRVAFARRVGPETGMVVFTAGDFRGILPEAEFSLTEGLVGWLIRNGKDLLVDDFSVKENYIPRFMENEPPAREYRSLVGVPFIFNGEDAVVTILESFAPNHFSEQTREVLKGIGAMVGVFIEKQRLIEQWVRTSKYDLQTGLGNFTAFKEHLEKELIRMRERKGVSTLAYLQLLEPNIEQLPEVLQDQFLKEYLSFILPYLGKMNYIYRLSGGLFAVLWVDRNSRQVMDHIEQLEKEISVKAVWCGGEVPGVQQAWGLVEFPTAGNDPLDIMVKAEQVVTQAATDENEKIKIYV